jgi:hypothetical protein
MRRTLSRVAIAAAVVAAAGCGRPRTEAASPFDGPTGGTEARRVRVEIQNLSFNDITVYAVRTSGQRQRIARVTGKTDDIVTIDWNMAIPISFYIEQVSGGACRTGQVGVEPGARVWLTVPSTLGQPCRAGRR